MKISLEWLNSLVATNESTEELAEKLSMAGFEVESIHDCSNNVKGVVIGKVLEKLIESMNF